MKKLIKNSIEEHKKVLSTLRGQISTIEKIASLFISALREGGKIIFLGNGGSAADSQHLSAELIGRFQKERSPLPALALSTNTSILTALGNDFGFTTVFSKQLEALGKPSDVVVCISTSGNSPNLVKAVKKAKKIGVKTVAFLGKGGGKLREMVDVSLVVKSKNTPRIQEIHILIGHIICQIVEEAFFGKA